jgi:hypothetical protein
LCREQALTLAVLAALYGNEDFMNGFNIFGVVKETGVDDEGLVEFHQRYFGRFPLFVDKSYTFYHALGDRKSIELPSLWITLRSFLGGGAWKRIQSKGITWNTKGEGVTKGGLIVFDGKGNPRYSHQEQLGEDLPVEDLIFVLDSLRQELEQQQEQDPCAKS